MSAWSDIYSKRKYWRLENTGDDFKDCFKKCHVLPYNNYPPMDIQLGQVFIIDYYHKNSDKVTRKYYIADGKVWNGMESTTEIAINTDPLKLEMISVNGYEYTAEYYGEQYIGDWSDTYIKREFWKLRNAYEDFENLPQTNDVLPYNNFPPMDIKLRQVFVIDYHPKTGDTIERKYYISDGCIWNDMECTAEVIIP